MEVFERENNWSSYQNRQLDVLQNIEKSFKSSLETSKFVNTNLTKIEYAMNAIAKELVSDVEKYERGLDKAVSTMEDKLKTASDSILDTSRRISDTGDAVERSGNKFVQAMSTVSSSIVSLAKNMWDYLGGVRGTTDQVNRFSDISNNVIQSSGMSGSVVREFRGDLMGIVDDLNSVTGALYSPLEAYGQIMSATQGVTSDLEAISEMARPLLLANETLDANIGSIADIFNRFYTRYNFSSTNMEDALNEIRGNTAGNSANAEATVENIQALEKWISLVAKDDNTKREEMLEEISHYTSWLESMGMDSSPYTGYLEAIAYGDWGDNKELLNILTRRGISTSDAQNMMSEGQWGELTEAIVYGMRDMISSVQDSHALGRALDNLGIDRNTALDNWITLDSKNFTSFEDFLESVSKESPSMVDLAEDKFVSAADKTNHLLEQIYSKVASIQEGLPFAFSDIALAYALTRGSINPLLEPLLGSTGNSMVRGSRVLGGLASSGYGLAGAGAANMSGAAAATIGGLGVAAGAGLGVYGIAQGISDINSGQTGLGIANIAGGVAGGVGGLALLAGSPVGWGLLAASAGTLLINKVVEDMTELSGNAQDVQKAFSDIEKDLKTERRDLISSLSGLQTQFDAAESLEEQRSLLLSSGLASREELASLEESAMQELIDAYMAGAKQINDVTSTYLDYRNKEISGEQSIQQEEFIKSLSKLTGIGGNIGSDALGWSDSESDREMYTQIVHELMKGVSDEKTLKKINKYLKDDMISAKEFKALTTDDLFNDSNFLKQSVDVSRMQNVVSAYGKNIGMEGMHFTQWDQATEEAAASLLDSFVESWQRFAANPKNEVLKNQLVSQIENLKKDENKKYYNLIYDELGIYRKAATSGEFAEYELPSFDKGINYVPHDQLAIIHEGEAVVPKKYNPAANTKELRELASQAERSRLESARISQETHSYLANFVSELHEIKEFLAKWKEDDELNSKLSEVRSKHELSRTFVSKYMSV